MLAEVIMSDSIVTAAAGMIVLFAAVVYIVMAWPFFLAVAAVWLDGVESIEIYTEMG